MIQILTGVPGSGKSYFAVYEILGLLNDGCLVVHNIHGLADPRAITIDFGQMPLDADSLFAFLDQLRQDKGLAPDSIIHLYIDEAQRYYPYEYKDPKGVYFFDFHRHHGLHITLISQDIKKLSPKITTLAEFEIRAVKPIFQFTPGFQYNLLSSGEAFGKKRLSKKQEVFAAYTSFTAGTKKTKKSRLVYAVPICIVLAVLAYTSFQLSFANSFEKLSEEHNQAKKNKVEQVPVVEPKKGVINGDLPASSNEIQKKTEYLGPVVLDYSTIDDAVKVVDHGLEVWIPVKDFVYRFHPQIYGYGYFHSPGRKFIQMNAANSEYIYPVNNAAYVRPFIKSDPKPNLVAESPVQYPIHFENMSSSMPDPSGYTRADHELIYRRQHGYADPVKPVEASSTPVDNSTILAP